MFGGPVAKSRAGGPKRVNQRAPLGRVFIFGCLCPYPLASWRRPLGRPPEHADEVLNCPPSLPVLITVESAFGNPSCSRSLKSLIR